MLHLRRPPRLLGAAAVAVFFVALLALPTSARPTAPASTAVLCNPKNVSPSALAVPGSAPGKAAAGDRLNISFEYLVANYTPKDKGAVLTFPTVTAVFPLLPSGSLKINLGQNTQTVQNSKWSAPTTEFVSATLGSAANFSATGAYLTTAKMAVMASLPTGDLTLKVRWHWTLDHVKTGVHASGAWTSPTYGYKSPYLPSIFFPATYVGLASTSGSPVASNTTYVIGLDGAVANTTFRLVLEYPNNGTEIQSIYESSLPGATLFNATLPVAYRNGTGVPAGNYLMHVHDVCNALVHQVQVTVT